MGHELRSYNNVPHLLDNVSGDRIRLLGSFNLRDIRVEIHLLDSNESGLPGELVHNVQEGEKELGKVVCLDCGDRQPLVSAPHCIVAYTYDEVRREICLGLELGEHGPSEEQENDRNENQCVVGGETTVVEHAPVWQRVSVDPLGFHAFVESNVCTNTSTSQCRRYTIQPVELTENADSPPGDQTSASGQVCEVSEDFSGRRLQTVRGNANQTACMALWHMGTDLMYAMQPPRELTATATQGRPFLVVLVKILGADPERARP